MKKHIEEMISKIKSFLNSLADIKKEQKNIEINLFNPKINANLMAKFAKAQKRLMFLDYDGTLIPFKEKPWEARPSKPLLELLQKLTSNKKNEVVIISGRDKDTLGKWFGKLPINLVAEHGLFMNPDLSVEYPFLFITMIACLTCGSISSIKSPNISSILFGCKFSFCLLLISILTFL